MERRVTMTKENHDSKIPPGFAPAITTKGQGVGSISGCGSRKRAPAQSFDPTHYQHRTSSQKQRPSVGLQDHVASLNLSIHQCEALNKAKGCRISAVTKSQLGQTNTSPAVQPESRLLKEVKTEIEDVALDTIQGGTGETVVQGTDLSNQPTCNIDVNFLQQVVASFEEVKGNQEESSRSAKVSISMNPSLEPTFLVICEKYGDITKDCPMESGYMLTSVLEVICKVVQELQKKSLTEVDRNLLGSYYLVVKDAEKMKVSVNWLRTRLDKIKDVVNSIVETKKLNDEKNRLAEQIENEKNDLESMKAELKKLKSEIERKEGLLYLDKLLIEDMNSLINDRALKIQQFQNMPLMEAFR